MLKFSCKGSNSLSISTYQSGTYYALQLRRHIVSQFRAVITGQLGLQIDFKDYISLVHSLVVSRYLRIKQISGLNLKVRFDAKILINWLLDQAGYRRHGLIRLKSMTKKDKTRSRRLKILTMREHRRIDLR